MKIAKHFFDGHVCFLGNLLFVINSGRIGFYQVMVCKIFYTFGGNSLVSPRYLACRRAR